ncbi:MAG: V-type ATP synthase subunit F [bacterium]|nr:V-type ATP synthase subunit F [bacterium]MDT8396414.1 V-type ATP synthase subunit F [bacterium]
MSEVLVVGQPEIVEGFGLTGARFEAVTDPDRVEWLVTELMRNRDTGIVIITEDLYNQIPEKLRVKAEASARPLFITLPRPVGRELWDEREDLISRIIRRAIGYRLKIRR